jgi:hypothetical protein
MFTFLGEILEGILNLPYTLINLIIDFVNAVIVALAAFAAFLIGLLPTFPAAPEPPGGVMGSVLWFLPLLSVLSVWMTMVGLWLTFQLIKVALRWVKLL